MVAAVAAHAAGGSWQAPDREHFRYRLTDRELRGLGLGIDPLSVSADKIAMTAWRCAALLDGARPDLGSVCRSGEERLIEVYPAAALKAWGFVEAHGYKEGPANSDQRERLVTELESRADGLI